MFKFTAEEIRKAACLLRQSRPGRRAMESVLAICEGPALDYKEQQAVATLLANFWASRAGTVLEMLRRD